MTDTETNRLPTAPNPEAVEGLIQAMARAAADYATAHDSSMSDIFSATMTLTFRTTRRVLYETDPPMTVREVFRLRKTIIGGIERLWAMAAGGGPTSKFGAH